MVSIDELIYKFKLKYDKLDSQQRRNLLLPQIILYLNEGILKRILEKYGPKEGGFEITQKRTQDLQKLVIQNEELSVTEIDKYTYSSNLLSLTEKFLFPVRSRTIASKGNCKEITLYNIDVTHNDFNYIINDPYQNPNFEWRETIVTYASDNMYTYSDGTFTIDKVKLDYMRYPKQVDKAGYTHFDGSLSANVDFELPDYLADECVDMAVYLASGSIANPTQMQISEANIQKAE